MFEELVTLTSSEDEEDIEIVDERLNTKKISSPSKINKIVEVLRKKGHVPITAATKVRSVRFFSTQGPLRLDEEVGGEEGISWKKYKVKTVAAVSHKRRKIQSGVEPRPRPVGGLRQRFPNSRLPVPVRPRRRITDQLREQQYSSSEGSEISPPHLEDRAGGTESASDVATSSQEDFSLSRSSRDFSNLLAFESSEEEEEEDSEDFSPSSVTPNISKADGSPQVRDNTDIFAIGTFEEEEGPVGNHLDRKVNHRRTLAGPASPQLELLTLSWEDEDEPITSSNSEEEGRIFTVEFLGCDISEAAEKKKSEKERRPNEQHQSSPVGPGPTEEAAELLGISRSSQEEEEEEGGDKLVTPVSQISQGPTQPQSSAEVERPEEVPAAPPVSEPGGQEGAEEAGLSQREFLWKAFGLCSHQEAEEER